MSNSITRETFRRWCRYFEAHPVYLVGSPSNPSLPISPARGVLVPAALTDDEAVKIGADAVGNIPTDPAEIRNGAYTQIEGRRDLFHKPTT
jgi:hypothetical protein